MLVTIPLISIAMLVRNFIANEVWIFGIYEVFAENRVNKLGNTSHCSVVPKFTDFESIVLSITARLFLIAKTIFFIVFTINTWTVSPSYQPPSIQYPLSTDDRICRGNPQEYHGFYWWHRGWFLYWFQVGQDLLERKSPTLCHGTRQHKRSSWLRLLHIAEIELIWI